MHLATSLPSATERINDFRRRQGIGRYTDCIRGFVDIVAQRFLPGVGSKFLNMQTCARGKNLKSLPNKTWGLDYTVGEGTGRWARPTDSNVRRRTKRSRLALLLGGTLTSSKVRSSTLEITNEVTGTFGLFDEAGCIVVVTYVLDDFFR